MTRLVDVLDAIAVVADLVACLALACQAPTLPIDDRRAIGSVISITRDNLEAIRATLRSVTDAHRLGLSSA